MKIRWLSLLLLPFFSTPADAAQTGKDGWGGSERGLEQAKQAYRGGDYAGTERLLLGLLRQAGKSPEAEKAAVMLTDVLLRQGKYDKAGLLITRFRQYYLDSPWTARMLYYQGMVSLHQGRNAEAAEAFVRAANKAAAKSLFENARRALEHLVQGRGLRTEELQASLRLLEDSPGLRALLLEALGDEFFRRGRYKAAQSAYEDWMARFGREPGAGAVRQKLRKAKEAPSDSRTIVIMAPFSGEFEEIGKVLSEGSLLAIEEYNRRGGESFRGLMLDTQGQPIAAVKALRRILREEEVAAVVGPAMSDVSTAVAVELSSRGSRIPMVTPTATTFGIADLGEGIFQFNVTTTILGRSVSAYALRCLGLRDFAILAPNTEYGYQLAEAFRSNVENDGGLVVAHEYYDPDKSDLAEHFRSIRMQASRVRLERERFERGDAGESQEEALRRLAADSVLDVQGLFLPASTGEEAYKLASQASYHKLKAQFLGSSGWNDKVLLHKASPVLQGAIFSADFPENPSIPAWQSFRRNYQERWGRAPDKVAALGYDATRFLLEGLLNSPGREDLIPTLRTVKSFEGVQGLVLFGDGSGANRNTALYRIERHGFKEMEPCAEVR